MVCFDDFEWSDLFELRLTAISQNVPAMGARGVELIVQRLNGQSEPTRRERIPTTYHHRTSCGCHTEGKAAPTISGAATP